MFREPQDGVPRLPRRGLAWDLWAGLWLVPRALGLVARTPSLRRWSVLAAALTAAALAGVALGAWHLSGAWAAGWTAGRSWEGWARPALQVVLLPLLFAAGALTVPNLLLSPLADPLSGRTSVACGRPPPPATSLVAGTALALRHTLGRLLVVTLGTGALFLLNLVPVAGGAAWVGLSTLWTAFWLAVEHLSTPMALRSHPLGEVVGVLRDRPGLALGLGLGLAALLWVPVVNCLLWPVAVVAGTLLFEGLSDGKALPSPPVTLSPPLP